MTEHLQRSAFLFSIIGLPVIIFFALMDESAVGLTETRFIRLIGAFPMMIYLLVHFIYSSKKADPSYRLIQWLGTALGFGIAAMDAALLYLVLEGGAAVEPFGLVGTIAGNFVGLFAVSMLRGISTGRTSAAVSIPYSALIIAFIIRADLSTGEWVFIGNIVVGVAALILINFQREKSDNSRVKAIYQLNDERANLELIVKERTEELEILFKELHHRVRNNLQTIIGVINLYESCFAGECESRQLAILRHAVQMIGVIHTLTNNDQVKERVNIRLFFNRIFLESDWLQSGIMLNLKTEDREVYVETALTMGLICVHQGMYSDTECSIELSRKSSDGLLIIVQDLETAEDDGTGQIMETLIDMIHAELKQIGNKRKLTTEIRIPDLFRAR